MRKLEKRFAIGMGIVEMIVTVFDPTDEDLGEWYGSGILLSGSGSEILLANAHNKQIETEIGTMLIDDVDHRGRLSFTFRGTGKPLV